MKLYEPLIERDLDAIPGAARAFLDEHSPHELFLAVARFAVLAYAPSQHAKRAVMACRAAWELRDAFGNQWPEALIECARYTAEARQPWSEPPMFEELEVPDEAELRVKAKGDALLMLETALALLPILGEKGKAALLRMPVEEMEADPNPPNEANAPIDELVQRVVDAKGSVDTVRDVFVWAARSRVAVEGAVVSGQWSVVSRAPNLTTDHLPLTTAAGPASAPPPYHLARDYAQTLIAHATPLPENLRAPFLAAVHHNLAHGESFADWSLA